MTVEELFAKWIEIKKITVKKTSLSTYIRKIETYLLPTLGNYSLSELNISIISSLIWELMGTLSTKSIIDIKIILQSALNFAHEQRLIDTKIKIPTPQHIRPEIVTFTEIEQKKIRNHILANLNNKTFLILIALLTGMRIGELCGLKYKDIKKICYVKTTVQRIKNLESYDTAKTVLYIGSPKSRLSTRPIPLTRFVLDTFKKIYDRKLDNCYILTNSLNVAEPKVLQRFYKKFLQDCNIDYKKFHTLRHTFSTEALKAGCDLQTIAEILGITVQILISTYIHSSLEEKIKCMNKMQISKKS